MLVWFRYNESSSDASFHIQLNNYTIGYSEEGVYVSSPVGQYCLSVVCLLPLL